MLPPPSRPGHTIQEATEDGESLLSLACSAGYYELAEVLLRMRASVEDRGVKGAGSCLPLSSGFALYLEHSIDLHSMCLFWPCWVTGGKILLMETAFRCVGHTNSGYTVSTSPLRSARTVLQLDVGNMLCMHLTCISRARVGRTCTCLLGTTFDYHSRANILF